MFNQLEIWIERGMGVYELRVLFCAWFNIVIRIIIYAFEELRVLRFCVWKFSLRVGSWHNFSEN